jgi:hypothetical protein
MGKSFKKEVFSDNSNNNKSKSYKRRKNQVKEDYSRYEYSDYNIHGYKRDKSPM